MPTWADPPAWLRRVLADPPAWGRLVRADPPAWLRPRRLVWAVLAVLVMDVRAVVHLRDDVPRCAHGSLPAAATALRSSLVLDRPTVRVGQDVRATVQLVNTGSRDIVVVGVQAVLVAPAGRQVLSWTEPARQVGLVVRPGQYGEVTVTAHVARCPDRPETALPAGWYELVAVLLEPDGPTRSVVKPLVVGR